MIGQTLMPGMWGRRFFDGATVTGLGLLSVRGTLRSWLSSPLDLPLGHWRSLIGFDARESRLDNPADGRLSPRVFDERGRGGESELLCA